MKKPAKKAAKKAVKKTATSNKSKDVIEVSETKNQKGPAKFTLIITEEPGKGTISVDGKGKCSIPMLMSGIESLAKLLDAHTKS